jgi:hypothetical protein
LPARGAEDICGETNQFRGQPGKVLDAPIGPTSLDSDVLAIDLPERAQPGAKSLQVREAIAGRGDRQVSDAVVAPGGLRVGCARGQESTDR